MAARPLTQSSMVSFSVATVCAILKASQPWFWDSRGLLRNYSAVERSKGGRGGKGGKGTEAPASRTLMKFGSDFARWDDEICRDSMIELLGKSREELRAFCTALG